MHVKCSAHGQHVICASPGFHERRRKYSVTKDLPRATQWEGWHFAQSVFSVPCIEALHKAEGGYLGCLPGATEAPLYDRAPKIKGKETVAVWKEAGFKCQVPQENVWNSSLPSPPTPHKVRTVSLVSFWCGVGESPKAQEPCQPWCAMKQGRCFVNYLHSVAPAEVCTDRSGCHRLVPTPHGVLTDRSHSKA